MAAKQGHKPSERATEARSEIAVNRRIRRWSRWIAPMMVCAFVWFLVTGCNKDTSAMLQKLRTLTTSSYQDASLSKQTIDELKSSIAALNDEVNRTVNAGERLGTYYEMVGLRYMDQNMFGLAAQFFKKAIDIYPENPALAYDAGVCTAKLAQATVDAAERDSLFSDAATYYKNAIRIDGGYVDALYGLAVLYVFEMDRPADAEPYLLTILKKESRNFRAMFLLAQVYVTEGKTNDAVDLYNEIIDNSNNSEYVDQAKQNISQLRGGT